MTHGRLWSRNVNAEKTSSRRRRDRFTYSFFAIKAFDRDLVIEIVVIAERLFAKNTIVCSNGMTFGARHEFWLAPITRT